MCFGPWPWVGGVGYGRGTMLQPACVSSSPSYTVTPKSGVKRVVESVSVAPVSAIQGASSLSPWSRQCVQLVTAASVASTDGDRESSCRHLHSSCDLTATCSLLSLRPGDEAQIQIRCHSHPCPGLRGLRRIHTPCLRALVLEPRLRFGLWWPVASWP